MLRELGDACAHAASIADARGAGTLVWVRRFDSIEFAVVLEPDEPLGPARRALYAVMNAVADALAACAPPEKPITFQWPDTILIDGGILGGCRLSWPAGHEDAIPGWLVVGCQLRCVAPIVRGGAHPLDERHVRGTALASEGFERLDAADLISSFARHLMTHVDQWQAHGFTPIGRDFLARMPRSPGARPLTNVRGIDGNGDLLTRPIANLEAVDRRSLLAALATPGWLDPESQEPRL